MYLPGPYLTSSLTCMQVPINSSRPLLCKHTRIHTRLLGRASLSTSWRMNPLAHCRALIFVGVATMVMLASVSVTARTLAQKGESTGWLVDGNIWWKYNCDWDSEGTDVTTNIAAIPSSGEECGPKCMGFRGCTHFTWTNWQGGTCWLKTSYAGAGLPKFVPLKGAVCGGNFPCMYDRKGCP